MRMFECGKKTQEECDWYKHHWHFWYVETSPHSEFACMTDLLPKVHRRLCFRTAHYSILHVHDRRLHHWARNILAVWV